MSSDITRYENLEEVVTHFRTASERKKFFLLYAYNGIGKTRLSMKFKDAGKSDEGQDTLYFNAFTEDLFRWDNDLENDDLRRLKFIKSSRFFDGLQEADLENRIRPLLCRYADFNFKINYEDGYVTFNRQVLIDDRSETIEDIKVSRGEENIFIWCFFLAVAQMAIDGENVYDWVDYIYIDDPISSLDDNNAIAVASHLAQMIKTPDINQKIIVSSHHTLFFNVMWNELSQQRGHLVPYFLDKDKTSNVYTLQNTRDTPFYHHVAMLKELHVVSESGTLYTYHFNILRSILEKTAAFHGFRHFSTCIKQDETDVDGLLHARMINVLSHGNYSLFEPREMLGENKEYFKKILRDFMNNYRFNPDLFPVQELEQTEA